MNQVTPTPIEFLHLTSIYKITTKIIHLMFITFINFTSLK